MIKFIMKKRVFSLIRKYIVKIYFQVRRILKLESDITNLYIIINKYGFKDDN
jgi:hypothetical protein